MRSCLLIVLVYINSVCSAQAFSENFSSTPSGLIPTGWLQINGDNNAVSPNLTGYNFYSNAWVTCNASYNYPSHGNVIASTSWYTPSGISNDWLITPAFSVPVNAHFNWDALSVNVFNPESYEVRISSSGSSMSTFSTVGFSTSAESGNWASHSISLSAFSGQTIRIAFVNKSVDSYLLFLDNVEVMVPLTSDGAVVSVDNQIRYSDIYYLWYHPFCGTFKNYGITPVSQLEVNYQLNHDSIISQTISYTNPISLNNTASFCFTLAPPSFPDFQLNRLKIWVSKVNSIPEINHLNDTASYEIYLPQLNQNSTSKRNLVEIFNSSTSEPCSQVNSKFDSIINSHVPNAGSSGTLNVIRYQLNAPSPGNDPSYNQYAESRKLFYKISNVPTAILNGKTTFYDYNSLEINSQAQEYSYFTMHFAYPKIKDGILTTTLNMSTYYNLQGSSKVKLYLALLQKHYFYPNTASSQTDYYHVVRKMLPDGSGIAVSLPSHTLMPISFSLSYNQLPEQNSDSFWSEETIEYELLSFLQDTVTLEILQSISVKVNDITTGIKNDTQTNESFQIYPNPSVDAFFINLHALKNEPYQLEILNSMGNKIYESTIFENPMKVNVDKLENGLFFIRVKHKESISTCKLIVNH